MLCEKPFTSNADEAAQVVQAAEDSGLVVMEAMHYRYHPLIARLREVVDELGPVRHLQCWTSFAIADPADIRYDFALGGGALMDGGCYAIDCLRLLGAGDGQSEPSVTGALADPVTDEPDGSGGGPVAGRPAGLPRRGDGLVRVHLHPGRRVPGRPARDLRGRAGAPGQLHLPAPGPAAGHPGRRGGGRRDGRRRHDLRVPAARVRRRDRRRRAGADLGGAAPR